MLTFRLGLGFWLDSSYFLVEFILHQKQLGLHFCDVYVAFELHKIRYHFFSVGLTHYKATSDRTLTMDKHNIYFLRRTHPQIFSQSCQHRYFRLNVLRGRNRTRRCNRVNRSSNYLNFHCSQQNDICFLKNKTFPAVRIFSVFKCSKVLLFSIWVRQPK